MREQAGITGENEAGITGRAQWAWNACEWRWLRCDGRVGIRLGVQSSPPPLFGVRNSKAFGMGGGEGSIARGSCESGEVAQRVGAGASLRFAR